MNYLISILRSEAQKASLLIPAVNSDPEFADYSKEFDSDTEAANWAAGFKKNNNLTYVQVCRCQTKDVAILDGDENTLWPK